MNANTQTRGWPGRSLHSTWLLAGALILNGAMRRVMAVIVLTSLTARLTTFGAEPLKPRPPVIKPGRTVLNHATQDPERIYVKFRDDLPVRLRDGKLTHPGAGNWQKAAALLDRLERGGAVWQREHRLPEEKLDEMRGTAQRNMGQAMPDLNTAYILQPAKGLDAAQLIDEFNALDAVELAQPMPRPAPLPVVPDFEPDQGYLDPATGGIDAEYAWTQTGGTGTEVRIADVEYLWNLNHADLNGTLIGPQPVAPVINGVTQNAADHGTAVLGEMGGRNNAVGVTGAAHGSAFFVVAANTSGGYNVGAAVMTAAAALRAGDIVVLEQQTDGPATGNTDYVPIEWVQGVYNAIITAVGNGIIVVEAAGNGDQNLDDAIFNTGHQPFRPENDSGAIIVGAGGTPAGGDRARLGFSTFGSTVDLQGWGMRVVTTGYGDLHSADGTNNLYTRAFSGTSSATPIVAAACAALQGAHKAHNNGRVLSPLEVREFLRATGSPQLDGTNPATENIGPRPNLRAALAYVLTPRVWVQFAYVGPENGTFRWPFNTVPEGVAAVAPLGTVTFKSGRTLWTGTINKAVTLDAFAGPAILGR